MRIATIDVGTNTALLLVAEVGEGRVRSLYEEQRFVRLGEGVDATGRIGEAAMERLRATLQAYRERAAVWGVEEVVVGATSAARDARNGDEVAAFVRRETGLTLEVLSGEEEALWTFVGAVSAFDDLDGPCAVVDIGGGSTELIVGRAAFEGDPARVVSFRTSVDVGSVRLTERLFSRQPPLPTEVEAAERLVRRAAAGAAAPVEAGMPFVGAAGTATSLALVHGRSASWEALDPSARRLSRDEVHAWRERLLAMTFDEVLALDPAVMSGRADVFPAGVLVLDAFMETYGVSECRVSPSGLRHGLALRRAALPSG